MIIKSFIFLIALISLVDLILACESNCASCRNANDYYCLACNEGYQLIESGICIQDRTISNCSLYDQSLNCLMCRPSFHMEWNLCRKMYDGCLIYELNQCVQCMPGSFLSRDSGSCAVNYINCMLIDELGQCNGCYPKFQLQNGKCVYKSNDCISIDRDTGLCTTCSSTSVLIGYSCVPLQASNQIKNCYIVNNNRNNVTCKYCKQGYGAYFGTCLPFQQIVQKNNISDSNCSLFEYIRVNQAQCLLLMPNVSINESFFNNCLIVDFGFKNCLLCKSKYSQINNTCIPILNNFCLKLATDGVNCQQCKQSFFLKGNECLPFPPFCLSFNMGCQQCQPGFQLINGKCIDPNCQTINSVTGLCQMCVLNYQQNSIGICKFIDPNCIQFNFNGTGDCVQCIKGYLLKPNSQYCVYQDVNCLSFDETTGNCKLCKVSYYYNTQGQICIPLTQYCISADISGRCNKCQGSYTLLSNYQCLFLTYTIPNCKMIDKDNHRKCVACNDGFFAENGGTCQTLPLLCLQYDSTVKMCTQCNSNGILKNGICTDKNCKIFDLKDNCLACYPSYQFGNFGQCIPQVKDQNCKQYQFGICKSCSQRYYFNFQFICVPISPFCNTYDSNSGACTSCYSGYQLAINGQCTIDLLYSLVDNGQYLSVSCKTINKKGDCIECYPSYDTIIITQNSTSQQKAVVNCVQSIRFKGNTYCIELDSNSQKCKKCVSRMYVDANGNCVSIDQNCDQYNSTTGVCNSCYPGFAMQFNLNSSKTICTIKKNNDPNCEIRTNSSTGCIKCYSGYYYSSSIYICQQINSLCASANLTNGNCLSCYEGYSLVNGGCNLAPIISSPISKSDKIAQIKQDVSELSSFSFSDSTPIGCLQLDFNTNQCKACQWGYVLVNSTCIERNLNCQKFQSDVSLNCLQCYDGYKTNKNDLTKCFRSTLFVDHCQKYSSDMACIFCEAGYILSVTGAHPPYDALPPYICNQIDVNCVVYNPTSSSCQQCVSGSVLEGRTCIFPVYGVDPYCTYYLNKLCVSCKDGWILIGFTCSQN